MRYTFMSVLMRMFVRSVVGMLMGMLVMRIVVGMLVSVCHRLVCVGMRVFGHSNSFRSKSESDDTIICKIVDGIAHEI
jgi:hypothetical protein